MTARLGLVLVLVSLCASAQAQERRRVILVPAELGGFFVGRDSFRRDVELAMQERLRLARFIVLSQSLLSPAEANCREFDCLGQIADKHGAHIVVASRVVVNRDVKVGFHLRVRVVEKRDGSLATRERETDCDNCTSSQARDRLATLMSTVIANEAEPAPTQPTPSPVPTSASDPKAASPSPPTLADRKTHVAVSPPPVTTREKLSRTERIALAASGAVLGAAGIYFFAQGIVENRANGDVVIENGKRYRVDTTVTGQPLFFSLSAVALLACGALEFFAWYPWKVRVTPSASTTGAQVQVGWSF